MSEPESKPEAIELEPHQTNDWVIARAQEANSMLLKEIMKMREDQQWLLYSRVINTLFQSHYKLSFASVTKGESK